jgi:uncharacterized membrane protein
MRFSPAQKIEGMREMKKIKKERIKKMSDDEIEQLIFIFFSITISTVGFLGLIESNFSHGIRILSCVFSFFLGIFFLIDASEWKVKKKYIIREYEEEY